jgi:hypothetical protein
MRGWFQQSTKAGSPKVRKFQIVSRVHPLICATRPKGAMALPYALPWRSRSQRILAPLYAFPKTTSIRKPLPPGGGVGTALMAIQNPCGQAARSREPRPPHAGACSERSERPSGGSLSEGSTVFSKLLLLILRGGFPTGPDCASACGSGTPAAIRTRDPLLRRQMLYPTELRAH